MKRPPLHYSGLITNYLCTAKCRHCLYGCSQKGPRDFIKPEAAERIASLAADAGVRSLHIGGGEPFLNFDALCLAVAALVSHGVDIDYIETNAFWCLSEETVVKYAEKLRKLGAHTIMASVDPFHIEFVPLERPLLLCRTLRKIGMDYFIWQERYVGRLSGLDPKKTHTREALMHSLGRGYLTDTAREYGLGINGRALGIAREIYPPRPAASVASHEACPVLSGNHAHIDLYGNVIPPGCPGISIALTDYLAARENGLGSLDKDRYPVVRLLGTGGTRALLEYAESLGFETGGLMCSTNCELCYVVRRFLRKTSPSPDIAPDCFYTMMENQSLPNLSPNGAPAPTNVHNRKKTEPKRLIIDVVQAPFLSCKLLSANARLIGSPAAGPQHERLSVHGVRNVFSVHFCAA